MTNNKKLAPMDIFWIVFSVVLGIFLLVAPKFLSSYLIRTACTVLVYTALAMSLNIMCGYCGILSMGHSAFLMLGAYISAILMRDLGCPWIISAICAAAGAAVLGIILGLPTVKLSGAFLVMVTIGFSEIVKTVALVMKDITGGALGIKGIKGPKIGSFTFTLRNGGFYYLALFLVVVTGLLCIAIKNSKWGRNMRAVKDDELAVSMIGLKPPTYKILAFVIASSIAGFLGAYYAALLGYIAPDSFSADMSKMILCAVLLGGLGNVPAMGIGALAIIAIQEFFRFASEFRYVAFGMILILLMRFAPQGLFGAPSKKPYKLPKGVVVHNHTESKDGGEQ